MAVPGVVTSQKREVTISRQSIYEEASVLNHEVGTRLRLGDRIFRYGANATAAALVAGNMTSGPTTIGANHNNISVTTSAVVGQTYVDVTLGASAATLNQYAGGYIWFNAGGVTIGEGSAYKIKSHLSSAGSATLRVYLYDPLACALIATTTKATLYANPWSAVVIHPATATNRPTGVPLIAVTQSTATISYYAWLQTGGFCAMFMGATYGIGAGVYIDDTPGYGLVPAAFGAGVSTGMWGVIAQIGSAAEHPSLVWLTIDV